MSYQVLARKWRPRKFAEVVGQEHVLRALINALDNNRLHHAYLFTGTRGVGKTTLGRILAKSLNCENGVGSEPCGVCGTCREIDEGRFVDLIEVDAASRTKVEDTRELLENVQYAPTRGRFKVYLIDEVHMLSNHSFNALSKTLEEPPPHVKFLLATTDPQRLPVTILSRCLKFNLKCIAQDSIVSHLTHILGQEDLEFELAGLRQIAHSADGSMRDALSLLDQAIAFGGGRVSDADVRAMLGNIDRDHVFALLEALAGADAQALLECSQRLSEQGVDFATVLAELISTLHRIALAQLVPDAVDPDAGDGATLRALAQKLTPEDIQLYYQIGLLGRRDLPLSPDARSGFEMIMLRMLAFRPRDDEARPVVQSAAVPRTATATRDRGAVATAAPTPSANRVDGAPPGGTPSSPASPPSAPAPGGNDDWAQTIHALRLSGMLKQLAINCAFVGREGDTVRLTLQQSHSQLASPNMVERLQAAMQEYYQAPIRLSLEIGDAQVETPAKHQERVAEDRRRAAHEAIQSDPNVRAMEETFDARVDPQSIRPVD